MVVELCQQLSEILSEKIAEYTVFIQWFNQPQYQQQQQQMPFDWMYVAQDMKHGSAMLELFEIEKKLVEMKGLTLAGIHYTHLNERLCELEKFVHVIEAVGQRERCVEKIQTLRSLLEEHIEFSPAFVTVPEQYFQHQQKYEKMCQLVGELEGYLVECQVNMVGGMPTGVETRFNGLNSIHQTFVRLVQVFQIQFPECFGPKVDEIVAYLRNVQFNGRRADAVVYGQELKEKLVEFETILAQPESQIVCMTTSVYPQSSVSTLKAQRECMKYLIRQVRDLKQQVQYHLNGNTNTAAWNMETLINQQEQRQQLVEEATLVDLLDKNLWIDNNNNNNNNGEFTWSKNLTGRVPHMPRQTVVKSLTMPVNGLMKPISIENFIQQQAEWTVGGQQQPQQQRGQQQQGQQWFQGQQGQQQQGQQWFQGQQGQQQPQQQRGQQQQGQQWFHGQQQIQQQLQQLVQKLQQQLGQQQQQGQQQPRQQEQQQRQPEQQPRQQEQQQKLRYGTPTFELVDQYDSEEEDFDFATDAEFTISSLLNKPTMVRIEGNCNGNNKTVRVEGAVERLLADIRKF